MSYDMIAVLLDATLRQIRTNLKFNAHVTSRGGTVDAPTRGPYVKAALLCEKVLIEGDGVASLIRVVDRINKTVVGRVEPPKRLRNPLTLVVFLNPGDARGSADFELRMEAPNGISTSVVSGTIHYEAPDQAVNIRADLDLEYEDDGIYWFDFLVEGALLSRMPLTVRTTRITPGSAQRPA